MPDDAEPDVVYVVPTQAQHVDADAQRIMDAATGGFAASFAQHKQTYVDNARQAQTRSLGTVTDAGPESQSGDHGRVLVAVTVTSTAAQSVKADDTAPTVAGSSARVTLDKIGARSPTRRIR